MAGEPEKSQQPCKGPSCATGKGLKWAWICCAGPLLLLLILPVFGLSVGGFLGGLVGSLFPLLAVLACPLGMYFLMRGMQRPMGEQQAQQGTQIQPVSPPVPEVIEVTEYEVRPVTGDGRNAQLSEGGSISEERLREP